MNWARKLLLYAKKRLSNMKLCLKWQSINPNWTLFHISPFLMNGTECYIYIHIYSIYRLTRSLSLWLYRFNRAKHSKTHFILNLFRKYVSCKNLSTQQINSIIESVRMRVILNLRKRRVAWSGNHNLCEYIFIVKCIRCGKS